MRERLREIRVEDEVFQKIWLLLAKKIRQRRDVTKGGPKLFSFNVAMLKPNTATLQRGEKPTLRR